jgi:hypothetical protein
MAIRKLDRSFAPTNREIRYLNKTFAQWRQSLIDFAKVYYPSTYSDFNESSPGMMFIEMASYVGDVLTYYMDTQFRENLLPYAQEQTNILAIAQALGFKPKPSTAAYTDADFYQLCPAADSSQQFAPDTRFMLKLAPNTVVSSQDNGAVNFRTIDAVDFGDPDRREITIYAVNVNNQPVTYLVKKTVKIVAGDIRTYKTTFGDPQRFAVITVPDSNVLEILSAQDSNGFTWSEVDFLAQDLIIQAEENANPTLSANQSVPPSHVLKIVRTPRRFVTRYNDEYQLELHFGSGILDDTDATINLQPNQIASDEYQRNLASTSLDPSDFLSSNSYGLSPSNVDLTITYAAGGGLGSNVPSNAITKINTVEVTNDKSALNASENALFNDVVASLAVNNPLPAVGGKDSDSVEEVRQNALAFFNAQNRVVNVQDYMVRAYAMPPQFGGAAKAFVIQDTQISSLLAANVQNAPVSGTFVQDVAGLSAVNLYLLGFDANKRLITLNDDVKKNFRTYLDQYRILTDELRILDAFVVNLGVNFSIIVFKSFNMNEVLARCIDALKDFFAIDNWQINQPIIVSDVMSTIAGVEGVQSVTSLNFVNKYAFQDGSDYNDFLYDIGAATINGVIYPSLDPMIWEVRYPDNDIVGSASS